MPTKQRISLRRYCLPREIISFRADNTLNADRYYRHIALAGSHYARQPPSGLGADAIRVGQLPSMYARL